MSINPVRRDLDEMLNEVSYSYLNSTDYIPGAFALQFMSFIKLVNGGTGESNKTPPMHLAMLDGLENRTGDNLANLLFRGAAKALSLDTPILTPLGYVPMRDIHVGDEVFDRLGQVTWVTHESEIFKKPTYTVKLVDGTEFVASEDHINIVQWRSTKNVNANGKINSWKEGELTIKELLAKGIYYKKPVSDKAPSGREYKYYIPLVHAPLEFPEQPVAIDPYTLGVILGDGHIAKENGTVSITTHEDDFQELISKIPYETGAAHRDRRNPSTLSFRLRSLHHIVLKEVGTRTAYNKVIPAKYLYNSKEVRIAVLRGLMDTDGTISPDGYATFCSASEGLAEGVRQLVKSLGGSARIRKYGNAHAGYWNVSINLPEICPFSMERKARFWVLGKTINSGKRIAIESIEPTHEIQESKCIAVASETHSYIIEGCTVTHNTSVFMEYMTLYLAVFGELPGLGQVEAMIYVSDSMDNGVKNARKNIETRYDNSAFLQEWLPEDGVKFTDAYLEFHCKAGNRLGVKLYGAKTGIRGSKIFAKRPTLAVLDDLVSDEDANSKASMQAIMDTVYKGVNHALDPTRRLTILNGTPFHKEDLMVSAVESGGWHVNVWPVCEKFPCEREEFQSAWPDRFTYEFIKNQYDFALANGKMAAFQQELMLRITSEEDRLIQDSEIRWYSRATLLKNKHNFNFYITTDFATSEKQSADYSVISVWAYNANGDWFWVDGVCLRQTMDKSINDLFRLVQEYRPQQVGIEVTGQQGAFIQWLQQEQMNRNLWFSFASSNQNGAPGVRPIANKLQRFNVVVPWFKAGKMYFPQEMKHSQIMGIFMGQIRLATAHGLKGKDDAIDTISMLATLKPWKPAEGQKLNGDPETTGLWEEPERDTSSPMDNYLV